jgi:hypothetical protein
MYGETGVYCILSTDLQQNVVWATYRGIIRDKVIFMMCQVLFHPQRRKDRIFRINQRKKDEEHKQAAE